MNEEFWTYIQELVYKNKIVVDRPKGSTHNRYGGKQYPVNYGYLEGTTSSDGGGVDIWIGSLGGKKVVGILCTVDMLKKDTELKILYDCTVSEISAIEEFTNTGQMRSLYILKVP